MGTLIKTKKCSRCKLDLPIENFSKSKNRNDGYKYECKKCCKEVYNNYYKSEKGVIKTIYI